MRYREACLLSLALISLAACNAAAREPAVSKYTSTAATRSGAATGDADDPTSTYGVFRGFGSYDLEHVGGDERSWVNIRFRGKRVDLYEPTMEAGAAIGAFPHKANNVVEWRGTINNGRFVPKAVIYRIVGLDDRGRRRKTRLLVIRLDGERSRIVGHADEPAAEAKARELADHLLQ